MKPKLSSIAPSSLAPAGLLALALVAVASLFSGAAAALLGVGLTAFLLAMLLDFFAVIADPATAEAREAQQSHTTSRLKPIALNFALRRQRGRFGRLERVVLQAPETFLEKRIALEAAIGSEWRRFALSLLPLQRGRYKIAQLHVSGRSPLRFWRYRHVVPVDWKISVYPNLQNEDRNLAAFLMRRDLSGMTTRRLLGMGREFDRLREYQPGDSYSEIYWKASARRMAPTTMVKQVERTQQVYAIIDASRASRRVVDIAPGAGERPAQPVTALDRYINGALSLALAAQSQGDLFGMIGFSRMPELFLRARAGKSHYLALQDALVDAQAKEHYPNYEELFSQVRARIHSRSLLVVFTHFDDASLLESFLQAAKLVARQHLVLAVCILPPHARPLFESGEVGSVDDAYDRFAGHADWKRLREAELRLAPLGIKLLLSSQENLCSQVVTRYLRVKERQLV